MTSFLQDVKTLAQYCSDATEERDWEDQGKPADGHIYPTAIRVLEEITEASA